MLNMKLYVLIAIIGIISVYFLITFNLNNFPQPTGRYGVGEIDQYLIDKSRIESNNNKNSNRELMLHIWYPIDSKINKAQTLYDKDAITNIQEYVSQNSGIPIWLLNNLKYTKTYAQKNKNISQSKQTYPVIIISNASNTMAQHYTWLTEELASQGYIVVGINHPYMAAITRFPDGRVVRSLINAKKKEGKSVWRNWKNEQVLIAIQDDKFVLDKLLQLDSDVSWPLRNKLDLNKIGICGHSFAGSLAMLVCLDDKRIKAGVALDSQIMLNDNLRTFPTPFLELIGQKSHQWRDEQGQQDFEKLMRFSNLPGMNMSFKTFKNLGHAAFSDIPLLLNQTFLTQILSKFIDVDVDASSGQVNKDIKLAKQDIVSFFDKYLKNSEN